MHEPALTNEQNAQVASLLTCDGWPLIVTLFADSEFMQLEAIRSDPLAPEAQAAAVKLAHIEELRGLIRSITPSFIGDPFDGTRIRSNSGDGPETRSVPDDPQPDDYDLS